MSIPNSLAVPFSHLPPSNPKFILKVCESVSVLKVGSFISLLFRFHIIRILYDISPSVWLSSFRMILSGSNHVAANFFLIHTHIHTPTHPHTHTTHIFIHSSVIYPFHGHLGCFHVLVIISSAAVNIGVHVYFWIMFFSGYMPWSVISGSYGESFFISLRSFHSVLPSGCTNLHSHQKWRRVLFSPHPFQHYLWIFWW